MKNSVKSQVINTTQSISMETGLMTFCAKNAKILKVEDIMLVKKSTHYLFACFRKHIKGDRYFCFSSF